LFAWCFHTSFDYGKYFSFTYGDPDFKVLTATHINKTALRSRFESVGEDSAAEDTFWC